MTTHRPLYEIAMEIRKTWKKVNFAAEPYLQAMETLTNPEDDYYYDSGKSVIAYFLANASSFRGENARRIKKELKSLL